MFIFDCQLRDISFKGIIIINFCVTQRSRGEICDMKEYYSVGKAAKIVGMTPETLRHYDRIGLAKPSRKDEWTGYRYYTGQDIVRLKTVQALRQMDLPLGKIKEVLQYDDLDRIIDFLSEAEERADEKIALLEQSKAKIRLAKADYERKRTGRDDTGNIAVKYFPERVIMLSKNLKEPTLDNLWNYLSHFYGELGPEEKKQYEFEDLAGVYTEGDLSRLFAVCARYPETVGLKILPAGNYICSDCTGDEMAERTRQVIAIAEEKYNAKPSFHVHQVVVSGILQWHYQVQVFVGAVR